MQTSITPENANWSRLYKSYSILLVLLLAACGGGSDGDGNSTQTSPVLQVSNIRTLGTPSSPIIVYNESGDGISVWEVSTFTGHWLYYSLYDRSANIWSAGEELAAISISAISADPQVATNGRGFAVVWREYRDTTDQLFSSLYNGTGWTTPQNIGGGEDDWGIQFQIVSNGSGYAVTWEQDDNVYVNLSLDGTTWDSATMIDSSSFAGLPRIASNDSGYAILWTSEDRLEVKLFTGSDWTVTEFLDDAISNPSHGNHWIESNGNGYAVIWSSWDGTEANLWSRTYYNTDGFNWSEKIAHYTGENSIDTSRITSNGTGYAITYSLSDLYSSELYVTVSTSGSADWQQSSLLDDALDIDDMSIILATDKDSYAVAWRRHDGFSGYVTYASIYNGTDWEISSSPMDSGNPDGLKIEQLAGFSGTYIISWLEEAIEEKSIFARVYSEDIGWSDIELLENGTGEAQEPSVAVSPVDGLIVAWNQLSNSGSDISSYLNSYNDKQWNGEEVLATGNYYVGSSYHPQLLTNDFGVTLAVWLQHRNSKLALFANIFKDGVWDSPILLHDSDTHNANLTTDGNGFAVIWQTADDSSSTDIFGDSSIYANIYNETVWSDKKKLADNSFNSFFAPLSIASNGNGYMLVYSEYDPDESTFGFGKVFARYYDGMNWHDPKLLSDTTFYEFSYPQIETDGQGYLSIWIQFDAGSINLYSSEYDGTSWSDAKLLATEVFESSTDYPILDIPNIPRLVSNGEGYLVVWFKDETIMASLYSGSWKTPIALGQANLEYYRPEKPYAVSNGVGYAVAWRAGKASGDSVNVDVHDGKSWLGVTKLYSDTLEEINFSMFGPANLLATAGDKYAVIWGDAGESIFTSKNIFSSIFDGMKWSDVELLDVSPSQITDFQLASNGDGFLAAWLQDDGSGNRDVVTNRYEFDSWSGPVILDVDTQSTHDLFLTADWEGYHSIWTQGEPGDDPLIHFPWAKVRF